MAKLLHHRHTGHLQPHHRTSYPGLAFVLLVFGTFLLFISQTALGSVPAVNPQSGAIGVSGLVLGPPPSTQAVILSPGNGSHTSIIPITVSGTCTRELIVSIFANDIFVGSTVCTSSGSFSLQTNLFEGQNTLAAKVSDSLGQYGPDSAAVTVTYDSPSLALKGSAAFGHQLYLLTSTPTRGAQPGNPVAWELTIVGGTPPFAVSWDWGDGQTDLVSRQFEGPFSTAHSYDRPGVYRVIVKATDGAGNSAFLQLVTIVNGPVPATATTSGGLDPGTLVSIWPLYILACLFVLAFWLGERRELKSLRNRHLLVSSF